MRPSDTHSEYMLRFLLETELPSAEAQLKSIAWLAKDTLKDFDQGKDILFNEAAPLSVLQEKQKYYRGLETSLDTYRERFNKVLNEAKWYSVTIPANHPSIERARNIIKLIDDASRPLNQLTAHLDSLIKKQRHGSAEENLKLAEIFDKKLQQFVTNIQTKIEANIAQLTKQGFKENIWEMRLQDYRDLFAKYKADLNKIREFHINTVNDSIAFGVEVSANHAVIERARNIIELIAVISVQLNQANTLVETLMQAKTTAKTAAPPTHDTQVKHSTSSTHTWTAPDRNIAHPSSSAKTIHAAQHKKPAAPTTTPPADSHSYKHGKPGH